MAGELVPQDDLPGDLVPASDLPSAAPARAAPSQRDVRLAEPKPKRVMWGDAGAAMNASDAYGEVTDLVNRGIYNAGGWVTDKASKVLSPEIAGALGFGTNVGLQGATTLLGMPAGNKMITPAVKAVGDAAMDYGRTNMWKALRPDKAARESGDAAAAVETLLKEGVNVSEGGVRKLTGMIDELDNALTAALAQAQATQNVSTIGVIRPIQEAIQKFSFRNNHAADSAAIRQELLNFFDNPHVQGALQIPVDTAQKIKRALYQEIGEDKFGKLGAAAVEGKKAVARGLNESLGRVSPEAAAANAQMKPLINARDLAEERVLANKNKMDVGLGWLAMHPWAIPGWLLDRSATARSLAGRAAYTTGEGVNAIAPSAGTVGGAAVMGVGAHELGSPPPPQKEKR